MFVSVAVTLALFIGVAYVGGAWLDLWGPQTSVGSAEINQVDESGSNPQAGNKATPIAKPFRERADEMCLAYLPPWIPLTTPRRAHARARGFLQLTRKMERIRPPRGLRGDYRALLASFDDVASAVTREGQALAQGRTYDAYTASTDASRTSRRAQRNAQRLHLKWCAGAIYDAGT